jgi:hypothetical protein
MCRATAGDIRPPFRFPAKKARPPGHLRVLDSLVTCYQRYYEQLDRDVDFETEWLPAVAAATEKMVADPGCKPV